MLVGYYSAGTGGFLAYDVIAYEPGETPRVAAHREGLSKGSLAVEGVELVDYSAVYRAEEGNCCPSTTARTTLAFGEGGLRVADITEVPIDQQPPGLFTT